MLVWDSAVNAAALQIAKRDNLVLLMVDEPAQSYSFAPRWSASLQLKVTTAMGRIARGLLEASIYTPSNSVCGHASVRGLHFSARRPSASSLRLNAERLLLTTT
jgi:hypothetical protein